MKNYVELIAEYYPSTGVSCNGDASNYEDLIWDDIPIPQADLDVKHIESHKVEKNKAIDTRTEELIKSGFSHNSSIFSLSEHAQINWIGIKQAADSGLLTYPMSVTTIDDSSYDLADAADVTTFYMTGLGTKKAYLDSGRALKIQVNATTTEAEIDAIEDNR